VNELVGPALCDRVNTYLEYLSVSLAGTGTANSRTTRSKSIDCRCCWPVAVDVTAVPLHHLPVGFLQRLILRVNPAQTVSSSPLHFYVNPLMGTL